MGESVVSEATMQLDTIACMDCVEWLKTLPENSVDE